MFSITMSYLIGYIDNIVLSWLWYVSMITYGVGVGFGEGYVIVGSLLIFPRNPRKDIFRINHVYQIVSYSLALSVPVSSYHL